MLCHMLKTIANSVLLLASSMVLESLKVSSIELSTPFSNRIHKLSAEEPVYSIMVVNDPLLACFEINKIHESMWNSGIHV
jgi:hypothetical protein